MSAVAANVVARRPPLLVPALLFFISGAVAMVYEVAWQRRLAVVFGSSAPASAAALAAFFAGLAAGGMIFGALARRCRRPLRVYAFLEIGIALGAWLVAPLLEAGAGLIPVTAVGGSLLAARLLVAFAALALPTLCMGGTLPLLAALVDHGERRLGLHAGLLYVWNTVGAALGALLFPFLLLPVFGAQQSVLLCAAANLSIAAAAWWLDNRLPRGVFPHAAAVSGNAKGARRLFAFAFLSGLLTFALQVLWNRAFAQVHENSAYSFAVIAACFIIALAMGGHLGRLALRRGFLPARMMGFAWLAGGILTVLSPFFFVQLTGGLRYLASGGGWWGMAGQLALLAVPIIVVPVVFFGFVFPALMEQAGRLPSVSMEQVLGRLLAFNLAGAVAGALLGGFLLPRALGLWSGLASLGALSLAAGVSQLNPSRRLPFHAAVMAGFVVVVGLLRDLPLPRVRLQSNQGERLVDISESSYGITAVTDRGESRRLKLNNSYVLGGTISTGDERLQAHLPLLLHADPRRVAMLGLGTGITASGALFHPVEELTLVELVPDAAAMARRHFSGANLAVLEDPRTRLVLNDARNYLRTTASRFDVIIGDLVVPWRQGEGSLFTLEQFAAARQALAPGGLFCQWLPLFQLSREETEILIRTFLRIFPGAMVWRGDFSPLDPSIALIGAAQPLRPDAASVARHLARARPDPANPQLADAAALWMHFIGSIEAGDLPSGDARINSEDQPWIELLGPLNHAGADPARLLTGRRLQDWTARITARAQPLIDRLGPEPARAVRAGALLAEYTLSDWERNPAAARAARDQIRPLLQPQLFHLLFPEAAEP